MTHYGWCEKCGDPVVFSQTPAYPVTGWEILRSKSGANSIHGRTRLPGRVRHHDCIKDDAQQSLLGK